MSNIWSPVTSSTGQQWAWVVTKVRTRGSLLCVHLPPQSREHAAHIVLQDSSLQHLKVWESKSHSSVRSPLNPAPQPVVTQQGHWGMPARIHTQSSRSVLILQPKQGAGGQGDTVETTQMKSDHLREMHERKPKFCSQKKSLEDLEPEGEIMSTNTCRGEKAGRESPPDNCAQTWVTPPFMK